MNFHFHQIIISSLVSFIALSSYAQNTNSIETFCKQLCGNYSVPYPFGFSDGCKIKFNCTTANSASTNIQIGNFLVQNLTSDHILISIPANCNRPIEELSALFGANFAPTRRTAFLLQNCSSPALNEYDCMIPSSLIRSRISYENCDYNMSCYSSYRSEFLEYGEVTSKGNCNALVDLDHNVGSVSGSAIVGLEFETAELGWWVDRECECDSNANCTAVVVNGGQRQRYRCQCNEGYVGDGFAAGKACGRVGQKEKRWSLLLKITIPVAKTFLVLVSCLVACIILSRKNQVKIVTSTDFHHKGHQIITYYELQRATENFNQSKLLGTGSSARVYKGELSDGTIAAIKVFNMQYEGALKNFEAEYKVLSNVKHRNLVKIISICSNMEFKAIILEFMPNGSLEKWLYSETNFLSLDERLNIVIDVAMAMEYLHHECMVPIMHCDLKPSNVLLDEDMTARVADFGIAKILAQDGDIMQTKALGTIGYIAPEYGLDGHVSTKGDVYSFGILLLETFTRRRPTDNMFSGDLSLPQWVKRSFPVGLAEVLDANLHYDTNFDLKDDNSAPINKKKKLVEEVGVSIIHVALLCLKESPTGRIDMRRIVVQLKKIRDELTKG